MANPQLFDEKDPEKNKNKNESLGESKLTYLFDEI
jgi:hypothetical protein